jgi:GNAT superfamily N-acetyltransferase
MQIRLATKNDLPDVWKLWLALIKETYPDESPSIEMIISDTLFLMNNNPNYSLIVAEEEGEIVGFVDGVVVADPVIGKMCGRGRHLYVKPSCRTQVIGVQLFRAQEEWGRKSRGIKAGKVNCIPEMVPLYEMLGYRTIEILMFKEY